MVANATGTLTAEPLRASDISPGPNDRQTFDADGLRELADSIAAYGLAQPPTVRPTGHRRYEIVCGERRFRAMTDVLGWSEVPCVVRELSDEQASAIMLAENVARRDIDPCEEARAYSSRMERFGLDVEQLSAAVGVSTDRIRRRLRLLDLTPEIAHLVARGQIGVRVAELLAGLDADRQRVAIDAYHRERLDIDGMRVVCDRLRLAQDAESMFDPDTFLRSEVMDEAKDARKATRDDLTDLLKKALPALERAGAADEVRAVRRALGLEAGEPTDGPTADYVRSRLASGPVPAADVLAGAQRLGVSERTLRRVKRALGVRSVRLSGCWAWAL